MAMLNGYEIIRGNKEMMDASKRFVDQSIEDLREAINTITLVDEDQQELLREAAQSVGITLPGATEYQTMQERQAEGLHNIGGMAPNQLSVNGDPVVNPIEVIIAFKLKP